MAHIQKIVFCTAAIAGWTLAALVALVPPG